MIDEKRLAEVTKLHKRRTRDTRTRALGIIVAVAMFVTSFIFLGPNITGNAIVGIDVSVSNLFGILLFFGGVIVVYVSVSRMLQMDFNSV